MVPVELTPMKEDAFTDPKDAMGLARNFVATYEGVVVRHNAHWWDWEGARYTQAEQEWLDGVLWKWLESAVNVTPTPSIVKNMVQALKAIRTTPKGTEMPCWLRKDGFPSPESIIPFRNGLLDTSGDEFRLLAHTPAWFSPNYVPHAYDAGAACPQWEQFLDDVFEGDAERKRSLQQWFGYNLTRDNTQQKFAVFCGPPAAGKSVTLTVLGAMLGAENVATPSLTTLWRFYGMETIFTKMAALIGDAHLENQGKGLAILDKLKSVVGGDRQNVDRKNKTELANLRVSTKFTIAFNEMPQLPDSAAALRRRMHVIPFQRSFEGQEDRGLGGRLAAEMPGIVAWSIRGLVDLRACGCLDQAQAGRAVLEDFTRLGSPISEFKEDCCELSPDALVPCRTLWEAWREWCKENGHNPTNSGRFGAMLKAAVPGVQRVRCGRDKRGIQVRFYQGIRLRTGGESAESELVLVRPAPLRA